MKRFCLYPGCSELVTRGRCAAHARTYDRQRGSFRERGYDGRWDRLSRQIRRQRVLCEECVKNGFTKEAECVDHVVPVSKGGAKYDPANLQALCWPCHSVKTARQDGAFGRGRSHGRSR